MIDYFGTIENCQNYLHTWILVVVILCILIATPIHLLIWRMLYYGMKEQEQYHIRREATAAAYQQPLQGRPVYVVPANTAMQAVQVVPSQPAPAPPATATADEPPQARYYQPVNQETQ